MWNRPGSTPNVGGKTSLNQPSNLLVHGQEMDAVLIRVLQRKRTNKIIYISKACESGEPMV